MAFLATMVLAASTTCSAFVFSGSSLNGVASRASVSDGVAAPPMLMRRVAFAPTMKRSAAERDVLELDGTVLESLRGADFRVSLDDTDQVCDQCPTWMP